MRTLVCPTFQCVSPRIRLYDAVFVISVTRQWIADLKRKGLSYNHFMTKHCWECMELNLVFLLQLILEGNSHLIVVCNSQPCERTF